MTKQFITYSKVLLESSRQALQQLSGNRLRTFLSLLGIVIGIFCIIGVEATVDSLEKEVRGSFDQLGEDVVYLSRFDWGKDPSDSWWRYMRRPNPSYEDYEAISQKSKLAKGAAYYAFIGDKTAKYRNSSVENTAMVAVTFEYGQVVGTPLEKGRFFSPLEYNRGMPKAVIGQFVAESLFGTDDPIGKEIKVQGTRFEVIGLFEKSGDGLINISDYDDDIFISYTMARQIADLDNVVAFGSGVTIKAKDRDEINELKDELIGIIRSGRRLKPLESNNFALNNLSVLSDVLDSFFSVIQRLGLVIGIFAIFVGAFSVANIMFVSVKERTSIIGIKKAIGARKVFILLEFLIESIVLCLIGGMIGLLLIAVVMQFLSSFIEFDIAVSFQNILSGLMWSIGVGILAGIIPAFRAASMDPVEAIRA